MNNQPARPLIAPSEYDQNRAVIANYRQYLDMYEKVNEQGLKNHEEVERIEMLLQQRIQAGEEAKRQLELLRQAGGRPRLTDGQLMVPDLTAMAPSLPPVSVTTPQASSSSAYIEEVHHEQMQPSTSSYRPYAAYPMNSSNTLSASYIQQPHSILSQNTQHHNQQRQRNTPISHLQAQPVMQGSPGLEQQSQIPQNLRHYPPHVQQQHHPSQFTQNYAPTQAEYHHNFQGYNDHSRQPSSSHPNAMAAPLHQSSTQYPQNPPRRGSASHQQVRENQTLVHGQAKAAQVVSITKLEGSSISRPESSSGPTPTGTANSAKVLSSSDGALCEVTTRKTQTPDVPFIPPSRPPVPPSDSISAQTTANTTRNSTTVIQLLPFHPAPLYVVPRPPPSSADEQHPPPTSSPRVLTPNQTPSQTPTPIRTPKQADTSHLARDILRALKRPRAQVSSSSAMEPEPKRHASNLAMRPTIPSMLKSSLDVRMVQPTASTSSAVASTQNSSLSVQAVQPTASTFSEVALTQNSSSSVQTVQPFNATSSAVIHPPPGPSPAPVAASTSTRITSDLPSQTTIPPVYPTLSVPAQSSNPYSRVGRSPLSFMVRSQINQGTSFGSQPSGSSQLVGQHQSSQVNVPAKPTQVPRQNDLDATSAESTNIPSTREDPPVPQLGKADSLKPPAVNPQGPSTTVASTVQPSTQKDPLFLPSPTSSPPPGSVALAVEGSLTSSPSARNEHKGKAAQVPTRVKRSPKLYFAHVLAPPLPDWARKWKAQQNPSNEVDELNGFEDSKDAIRARSPSLGDFRGPSTSQSPSPSSRAEDLRIADDEESIMEEPGEEDQPFGNYDEAERQMLHEHCSILREIFCRWDKCEVVLNTPGALLRHMKTVHGPRRINAESPWICQWAGCGYTVIAKDDYNQHIEKHAVLPLWCPFEDCTENFRTPRQCIKHMRGDHDGSAVIRRMGTPSNVSSQLTTSTPKIPKILPAYMTEFVRPASIPKQRHETLMITVRRRISGNVPAHLQRYNAARPMPMTPSGKNTESPDNTPYSFLEHRSTRYSSYLSSPARSKNFQHLDSSYVTNLARRGLVLWPDKDSKEALPEAMMKELERIPMEEEDAVEEELLNEESFDVFGPTIAITTPSVVGEYRGVGDGGV